MKEPRIVNMKNDYNFERVDIFLRVKGRLPTGDNDHLSQEILDEYCKKFEEKTLTEGIVPLEHMYKLIKLGVIKVLTKEKDKESH